MVYGYRKGGKEAKAFALLMGSLAIWSFFTGFEVIFETQESINTAATFTYIGILTVPLALFLFSLLYSRSIQKINSGLIFLLAIEPFIMFIIIATNKFHGLFWTSHELVKLGSMVYSTNEFGPALYLNGVYSFILLFFSMVLLILFAIRRSRLYKLQSTLVIIGVSMPIALEVLTIFDINFLESFDLTVIAFAFTGLMFFLAINRFDLLEVGPVAKEMIMDRMKDPVVVLDLKGRIVDINPSGASLLNGESTKLVGKKISDLDNEFKVLFENLGGLRDGIHERKIKGPGGMLHFHVDKVTIVQKGMGPSHYIVILRDVSDQVRLEKQIRDHKDSLEIQVRQRTIELEKAANNLGKEIETRSFAEKKARNEFKRAELYLDLLGHDIGNINQVLFGWIQILKLKLKDNNSTQEELEVIETTIRRGISLVNDIKLMNRLEVERTEISPQKVIPVIGSSFEEAKRDLKLQDAIINLDIKNDKNPSVLADRELKRIFFNLFHNGLRAQESKKPVIEVRVDSDNLGGIVKITISDHGPGISDEHKGLLFQRRDRSGEKQFRGIGLMMVKLLVDRYNGRIEVKDRIIGKPEMGASFHILLPLVD
jgi:PAS domain S-box-containing protein